MKKQSNFQRLLEYAGGYQPLAYISWILSAISALLALVPFWYLWKILKNVLETAPNQFYAASNITYGWMAVLFAILSILVYIAGLMCSHLAAFRIATNLRIALMKHIALLPLGTIELMGSGKLRRVVSETAGSAETYLAHQLPDQARAIANIVGMLALLVLFDWRLGLCSLAPVGLAFLCMIGMTGKNMQEKMTEYQNALEDMSNEAVEYIRGIPVVKTFGQTIFSFKKFKKTIERYETWTTAYTKQLRGPMMLYTLAIHSVFVFLIFGAVWFTRNGVSEQFLLNFLFYVLITPVVSLTLTKLMFMSENGMLVQDTMSRMDQIFHAPLLKEAVVPKTPNDFSVEWDHVTFRYDDTRNALSNVSFRINSGQTVAFVGPSGGGKSTLASLVARFFDPQEGRVLIGGIDIRELKKETLMNMVSFVFQNSHLLKTTILENVRLGKPTATEEEVLAALDAAQCMDIIEKFPEGIHTKIGTEGVYLSGGEQQRIVIARAILKNAPILILDEATAFADPENEKKVQEACYALARGRTVISIAHRLSTVADADCILVLQDGMVAEQGTFNTLLEKKGLFFHMWEEYQKSVQWNVREEV